MQKAAEATGAPLRTLQRLSNANSESKKIKCKKAKLSREKFGKLDDFDLGVMRRLIHQFQSIRSVNVMVNDSFPG